MRHDDHRGGGCARLRAVEPAPQRGPLGIELDVGDVVGPVVADDLAVGRALDDILERGVIFLYPVHREGTSVSWGFPL